MNVDTVEGIVIGILVPVLIALVGREPIGKWLMAKYTQEETALGALIGVVQESVAGWRESNVAVIQLTDTVCRGNLDQSQQSDAMIHTMEAQNVTLVRIDGKVTALISLLAKRSDDKQHKEQSHASR